MKESYKLLKEAFIKAVMKDLKEDNYSIDKENTRTEYNEPNTDIIDDYSDWMYQEILNNGDVFISAAGGTANVMAGRLARKFGLNFDDAYEQMNTYLTNKYGDWYQNLGDHCSDINNYHYEISSNPNEKFIFYTNVNNEDENITKSE